MTGHTQATLVGRDAHVEGHAERTQCPAMATNLGDHPRGLRDFECRVGQPSDGHVEFLIRQVGVSARDLDGPRLGPRRRGRRNKHGERDGKRERQTAGAINKQHRSPPDCAVGHPAAD